MDKKKKLLIAALSVSIIGFIVFMALFLIMSGEPSIKAMKKELSDVSTGYLDEKDVEFCYYLNENAKDNGKKLVAFRDVKIYGDFRIYDVAYESERYVALVLMNDEHKIFKHIKYSTTSERAAAISDYIRQLDNSYQSLLEKAKAE